MNSKRETPQNDDPNDEAGEEASKVEISKKGAHKYSHPKHTSATNGEQIVKVEVVLVIRGR